MCIRDRARAVELALPPHAKPRLEHVPVSPGLKKVLALAAREALRLGHGYVGTEHLLLGLLQSAEDPGAGLLSGLGVTKDGVETWTLQALATWTASRA